MTENKFSLIDLGKLSKPISKLIEAVSQGIGTIYEPTKIRRKAKAQADASLIKVESDIIKKDLLRRAANRLAFQEISRQENIENVIKIAANSLPATVSEDPVDKDWISRFFDDCKDVSNEELQKLWGRLLAIEVTTPNSCSRKTLSILKDLTPTDAALFTKFCSMAWDNNGAYFFPYDKNFRVKPQLEKYGFSYGESLYLESLGLIHCNKNIHVHITVEGQLSYFNYNHTCYVIPHNMMAEIPCFPLTNNGVELLRVANCELNDDFYMDCLRLFSDVYSVFLACPMKKSAKEKIKCGNYGREKIKCRCGKENWVDPYKTTSCEKCGAPIRGTKAK